MKIKFGKALWSVPGLLMWGEGDAEVSKYLFAILFKPQVFWKKKRVNVRKYIGLFLAENVNDFYTLPSAISLIFFMLFMLYF